MGENEEQGFLLVPILLLIPDPIFLCSHLGLLLSLLEA
jgi:hypothetical protein